MLNTSESLIEQNNSKNLQLINFTLKQIIIKLSNLKLKIIKKKENVRRKYSTQYVCLICVLSKFQVNKNEINNFHKSRRSRVFYSAFIFLQIK